MRHSHIISIAVSVLMLVAGTAMADWDPNDGHKMHYPQLPDPNGWDVSWNTVLADDFQCSESGDITDLHFWYSWREDVEGQIEQVVVEIFSDEPAGAAYSHPKDSLWIRNFTASEFTTRQVGTGQQGWFDPDEPFYIPDDHFNFYQLNIVDIQDPFFQEKDTIYWVVVWPQWVDPAVNQLGWKTSLDHFNDDAVWWDSRTGEWQELIDPLAGGSLDLAFVVTPGPATMGMLALGALALLRRRRRSAVVESR